MSRPKGPVSREKVNLSLAKPTVNRIRRLAKKWKMYNSHVVDEAIERAYVDAFGHDKRGIGA